MAANNNINPNLILAAGAVVLAFLGGKKILEALGIVKTTDEKEREAEIKNTILQLSQGDYFDPDYYKKADSTILTMATALTYAKMLKDSKGVFNDDENKVYGVFQSLRTKAQISFLAKVFFDVYQQSLLSYLLSFLSDAEMVNVAKICNKLPAYK